ncbi:MAG TPA: Gfo/Idh/MocA family oxidoreductase [Burkholderiaceae bacterium]|nr:Gfo/Idh/MocA family oxidoreductase [Burkholderiaceae bacterium]
MSPAPVRVGIVGLGRLGRRHAENLARRVPGAALVAACSPVEEELRWAGSQLGIAHCFRDYAELLRHPGLDAVFLVTPTTLHAAQIIDALNAGKHVFCEKPLSLEIADCERVEGVAAAQPHLKVMIGFVRRFDASYREAHARIAQGAIGTPFLVRAQTCDRLDPTGAFVEFAASSGGIFLDCSVHDIDLARWLLGAPPARRVYAVGTNAVYQRLAEFDDVDNGLAICEFEGGKLACFYASRTMGHGHDTWTEIAGTAGRLTIGRDTQANQVQLADERGVHFQVVQDFYARFADAFVAEANAFIAAVRGEQAVPLTLADATEATRIGHALARAQRERRMVELR